MKKLLFLFTLTFWGSLAGLLAQETFPINGPKDERAGAFAFTNATIVVDDQSTLEGATLLIRDGKIEAVGRGLSVPKGYTTVDLSGNYIYPGLIDMYTTYGQEEIRGGGGRGWGGQEVIEPTTPGPYNANEAIKSYFNAYDVFKADAKEAEAMRKLGFGAVLTHRSDGVARGTSSLVSLDEGRANEIVLEPRVAAHYSFNKGSSKQNYPVSAMGYISLLRQTYLDAQWYDQFKGSKPFTDQALEAWLDQQSLPQIFEANGWLALLRADKVGDEFGVQYIIKGGGDEYKRIDLVKATKAPLIVPVDFPNAMDVEDPLDAYRVSLEDLKHWEMAPANLAMLEKNGLEFAITTDGLRDKKQFMPNLRKAIKYGLSEKAALRALTTTPARLMGVSDQVGSLKKGMVANFLITSGPLFDEETTVYQNWVQGKAFELESMSPTDASGRYNLVVNGQTHQLEVAGKPGRPDAKIVINDSTSIKVGLKAADDMVSLSFQPDPKDKKGPAIALSGWMDGKNMKGRGQLADGTWVDWRATYQGEVESGKPGGQKRSMAGKADDDDPSALGPVLYPFSAYGRQELPKAETILIRNATVWTMENAGKLENADVLIRDGKIAAVGKNLSAAGARVIDGTGKHVTPGIIDEHSHIGATSINETVTNSSMVRIGDVVNSEDLEIYRALSGGVTAIQILHGSANPIGGQSALIKLRWGQGPEDLKIKGADEYIKFALGENVKRSRSQQSIRFPQSRMGVEQVYMDAFSAARDYERGWKAYNALSSSEKAKAIKPRRDLAMDAMVEILNSERFITCHSYVQSEINMLMKVAEEFGFKVNTFTHILEGYKVADKMAEHGVGGSSFSDWWGYKWEVRYAIPYNAAIMHRAGVVTSINSDDAEMMRRLNQEAAKSIKYGGVSEEEALAMVTINPAKLLHLDDRMGSLKAGKDADVVVWSDHPLSIYARPEQTIVDGTVYFDIQEDQALKEIVQRERARIIAKMRSAKANGSPASPARGRVSHHFHCEDVMEYRGR